MNIFLVTGKKIRQKRKTKNEVVQPVTSEVDSIESSTIIKKSRKKRAKVVKDNIDIIENTINSVQDTVNQDNDEIINVSKEELLVTIIPNKPDTNTVVNLSFNQELEYALNHSEILCIPDSFESNINQDSDIEYNISEDLGNIFDTNFDNVSDNDDVIIISDSNMIINDIKAKDIKAAESIANTANNQNDVENISAFIKQHSQDLRNNDQVTLCTDEYNYSDNSTLNSSDIVSNNQDSVNIVNNNDSTIASLSVSAEADNKIVEKRKAKAIKTLKIRKRDGRIVDFDTSKIFNALKHAFQNVTNDNELDDDIDDEMLSSLVSKIIGSIKKQAKILDDNILPVETIQDIIEDTLLKVKQFEVAKTFIRYRANRTQMREANNDLISLYKKIHNASSEELEIKRDNANVNGNASMGVMLKLGTESNKYFLLEHVMKKEYAQAHKEGYIHIHDLDMSNVTLNCAQINLQKLFKSGFSTGHGYLRSPNSIRSYASLACIAIQSNQNEMFGGQSINLFDFYMSDGVRKSFKKAFKHNILIAAKTILKGSNLFDAYVEIVEDRLLPKYLDQNSLEIAIQDFLNNNDEDTYSDQIIVRCFKFAFDQACKDVEEETHQAMEALVHNFNTLASRAGSQVPFSSINFGCDTSHEGRLVTKEVLNAVYAGLGRGETSIFPICVFQMKAGINYNPGDPNYDLFQQSIKCSAKRLFPTYMSEDATYNAQYYDPKNIQTLCATMG